jgi:hypothetical protein
MKWTEEIAKLVYIKQVLADLDLKKLWPHHLPSVAATPAQIDAAEKALGYPLDSKYMQFLLHANGWRGFYQTVDLFGTDDLLGSARMGQAHELLHAIDDRAIAASGHRRSELQPIAATSVDRDIFFMTSSQGNNPGEVLWFAGELIDRFPNFEEFFLAMMDYNRAEVARFQSVH